MQYSEEAKIRILEKLDALATAQGSMAKASELVGVSSAVISGLKSGKYRGDVDRQLEIIEKYFDAREDAEEVVTVSTEDSGYKPTSISEEICAVIKNCQLNGGLAAVAGHAGIGKTMAVTKFARENPSLAKVITVTACTKSIKSVLKQLCEKFSIGKCSADEMWFRLVGKMSDKMVLIFDEAQHLPLKTIEMLRSFSDYFYSQGQTLGIVFVGNLEVAENFNGNRRADYAQIVNRTRLNRRYYTEDVTEGDALMLFPKFHDDEMKLGFMLGVCRSSLGIRGARVFYENAIDAGVNTYEELVELSKKLGLKI